MKIEQLEKQLGATGKDFKRLNQMIDEFILICIQSDSNIYKMKCKFHS